MSEYKYRVKSKKKRDEDILEQYMKGIPLKTIYYFFSITRQTLHNILTRHDVKHGQKGPAWNQLDLFN